MLSVYPVRDPKEKSLTGFKWKFQEKEIIMSNKSYVVLLVLAGMVCGILIVSLASSPAAAKLPTEERVVAKPVPARTPTSPTRPTRPVVARPGIRVYTVGVVERGVAFAYVVKDGKLWYCEGEKARSVGLH